LYPLGKPAGIWRVGRGVDKFFLNNSPDWRIAENFHSPNQETMRDWGRKNQ
jgi:hypothetical protein